MPFAASHDAPYATLLRLLRRHCHPVADAREYLVLVLRASNPPDAEMDQFKRELRDLLLGGVQSLPEGTLYTAAGYAADEDGAFLHQLWTDLYGTEPVGPVNERCTGARSS